MRRRTTIGSTLARLLTLVPQASAEPPELYTVEFQLAPNPPTFTTGQPENWSMQTARDATPGRRAAATARSPATWST